MATYTISAIQSTLGLSRAVVSGLIKAGFVTPTRGARREYRFSFQDMVLLRTAHTLQAARIPPRKILRALSQLKSRLPHELPLTGLRISAVGNEITVREGGAQWTVDSGQLLMDFELRPDGGGELRMLAAPSAPTGAPPTPDWFQRAVELEPHDPAAAEQAYRSAIEACPTCADPALNLGVMLANAGRLAEAVAVYRDALARIADQPLLHFNLAIALEDLGLTEEALQAYEACLRIAPDMADAHFNAGRLHEQSGNPNKALRHYNAYRRLQR